MSGSQPVSSGDYAFLLYEVLVQSNSLQDVLGADNNRKSTGACNNQEKEEKWFTEQVVVDWARQHREDLESRW